MKKWLLFSILVCLMRIVSAENLIVQLHDGSSIQVERLIEEKREGRWGDPFFGLQINPRVESVGNITTLTFTNPITRQVVSWVSEPNYTPLILDFIENIPYLVIHGQISKSTQGVYGCPELPYFFLKYSSDYKGTWQPVLIKDAPDFLRQANLLIPSQKNDESLQAVIPRTYDEWNYTYKKEHRDERKVWDCRPPRLPPSAKVPSPIDVKLEALESIDLPRSLTAAYLKNARDSILISEIKCTNFFAPVDPVDLLLGDRFILDSTGQKPLPYPGAPPIQQPSSFGQKRAKRLCDDKYVWFVAPFEEKGKVLLTKFSLNGDFIYNVRISDQGSWRYDSYNAMLSDVMRSEDGNLTFYWMQSMIRQDELLKDMRAANYDFDSQLQRISKFRFREPSQ